MFSFVAMLKEAVPNHDEMFRIFSVAPEKLTILPGLRPVFNNFIQAAIGFKKINQQA